jgi:hypothetical protein
MTSGTSQVSSQVSGRYGAGAARTPVARAVPVR